MSVELDLMEYATDILAQTSYVSIGIGSELLSNGDFETWTAGANDPPDNWTISGLADPEREGTIVKADTYSMKVIRGGGASYMTQTLSWDVGWQGKVMTFSCWVYATAASKARLSLYDGVVTLYSPYHTGDSTWQLLTVIMTIDGAADQLLCHCNIDGSEFDAAYFDEASVKQTDLQCYSESSIKQEGSYSLKAIAKQTDSLNETLIRTVGPTIDLSGCILIKFYAYASRTGSNFKIKVHDVGGTTTEYTVIINSGGTWEQKEIDISAVANADKDDIDQIIIEIINADADNTFYLDDIYAERIGARSFGIIIG